MKWQGNKNFSNNIFFDEYQQPFPYQQMVQWLRTNKMTFISFISNLVQTIWPVTLLHCQIKPSYGRTARLPVTRLEELQKSTNSSRLITPSLLRSMLVNTFSTLWDFTLGWISAPTRSYMESVTWEMKYILISEDLSQSHNRDDYSQDNIWPNSISITYIFLVCYDKETEYHYSPWEVMCCAFFKIK